jgi:putative heme-binding domain-containing protein
MGKRWGNSELSNGSKYFVAGKQIRAPVNMSIDVPGGDSGWRMGYQYMDIPVALGPWNAEKMWHTPWDGQAAYLVPPVAHVADGPAGFTYNPGVGLPERYQGHFYLHKAEVSCVRCHRVKGEGGEVGPDLTGVGTRQNREYLLESIVDPNRQIAKGFETVILELSNGQVVSGILKEENTTELRLMTAEGELVTVPRAQIEERQTGKSAMPQDTIKSLTKSEVRDLVEFLAGLK